MHQENGEPFEEEYVVFQAQGLPRGWMHPEARVNAENLSPIEMEIPINSFDSIELFDKEYRLIATLPNNAIYSLIFQVNK